MLNLFYSTAIKIVILIFVDFFQDFKIFPQVPQSKQNLNFDFCSYRLGDSSLLWLRGIVVLWHFSDSRSPSLGVPEQRVYQDFEESLILAF